MLAQVIAICIFLGMFLLIILDQFERHIITLVSGALLGTRPCVWALYALTRDDLGGAQSPLVLHGGLLVRSRRGEHGGHQLVPPSLFIAGMMIMVEGLGKAGFFRWLCLSLAKLVHYHVVPLLICFHGLSAVLSMFIDSITVVLFLATVTLELAQTMKFDPVPMILSEVFCANLGGAATMCGDPPNIIIGTSLGYTFFDFIENTGAIVAVCFAAVAVYFWLCFRKELLREGARTAGGRLPGAVERHHGPQSLRRERCRIPAGGRAACDTRADQADRRVHRRDRRSADAACDGAVARKGDGARGHPRRGL